jgi:Leucine-rich repeat (LRR) protein
MLKTFPEILEPAETFVHINLTKTAIKELPSSLDYLVGLQTLCLKLCTELVSLPNSIVNLNHLSKLDCSGCSSLIEIPNNIRCLSSLREISLHEVKECGISPLFENLILK